MGFYSPQCNELTDFEEDIVNLEEHGLAGCYDEKGNKYKNKDRNKDNKLIIMEETETYDMISPEVLGLGEEVIPKMPIRVEERVPRIFPDNNYYINDK